MGEESKDNSNPQPTEQATTEEAKLFTQTELDEKISRRVNELKAKQQKAIDDAVTKALDDYKESQRIESLQGEEKMKAEYQAKLDKAERDRKQQEEELATAKKALAISKAEAQLAALNLPTMFAEKVIGKDDSETEKNIQELQKAFNDAVAKTVNDNVAHGAPKVGASAGADPAWKQEIDRIFASH